MIPSKHSTYIVLTKAVTAFGLPYYRYGFCGAQGRVTTGHTSILYIVKSKSESMEKQVMQSRSKGASVWVDGWMDEYGLLLEVMAFLSRIILSLSLFFFFWDMVTPFSLSFLFFLGHASLACHLFSFWGNHNLTLFYFRDVLRERSPRHGALMWIEWVVVPILSVAIGWDVYVLMIEKAWKVSL